MGDIPYQRNNMDSDLDSVDLAHEDLYEQTVDYQTLPHTTHLNITSTTSPTQKLVECAREFAVIRQRGQTIETHDRTVYTPIDDNHNNVTQQLEEHESDSQQAYDLAAATLSMLPPPPPAHQEHALTNYFNAAPTFKMVVVGNAKSGKSTWRAIVDLIMNADNDAQGRLYGTVKRDAQLVFEQYTRTVGTDFVQYRCWSVDVNNAENVVERTRSPLVQAPHWNITGAQEKYVPYKLMMWEIGGDARASMFTSTLFPESVIVVIMLDACDTSGADDFTRWLREIEQLCTKRADQLSIVVCLNKVLSDTGVQHAQRLKSTLMAHLSTWPRSRTVRQVHYFETDFVRRPDDAIKLFQFITRELVERNLLRIRPPSTTNDLNRAVADATLQELSPMEVQQLMTLKTQDERPQCCNCTLV